MQRRYQPFKEFCLANGLNPQSNYHKTRIGEFPGLRRIGRLLFVDPEEFDRETKQAAGAVA